MIGFVDVAGARFGCFVVGGGDAREQCRGFVLVAGGDEAVEIPFQGAHARLCSPIIGGFAGCASDSFFR